MNKWKQAALAVLTLLLLLLGGALPFLAAAVQDGNQNNAVRYGDMDALELTLRGEEAEPLDMYEKLLMLQTGENMELARAEETVEADEELLAMAEKALEDYYAAGLLLWGVGDMQVQSHTAFFMYLPGYPEVNAYMWLLELVDPEGGRLGMVLDDETGKLLAIEYDSAVYLEKMGYDPVACCAVISEIYFSGLELTPFATEETYLDADTGMMQTYYLEKEGYENVMVVFSVQPDGFLVTPSPV